MIGFHSVGDVLDVVTQQWSGWTYPARRTVMPLLENELGSTGNVVYQDSALTQRQAHLQFLAISTADKDTVRGYEETGTTLPFVEYDGAVTVAVVLEFSAQHVHGDEWLVTVTLAEVSEAGTGS